MIDLKMFKGIPESVKWEYAGPLNKGWSKDKKFFITDKNGEKYLLRISDISLYEKKKKQFELLRRVAELSINASKPVSFGILDENNAYTLFSWLEGEDAEKVLSETDDGQGYLLGKEAGRIMKKLHTVKIEEPGKSWWERYREKIERKVNVFKSCPIELPKKELIIEYVYDNMEKVKHRPTLFQHGDYHCGNMIVKGGKIGIIDFDKNGTADPYDEFKCFCWNVYANRHFEKGIIDGYFEGRPPKEFFEILALYGAESLLGHMTWAMSFGEYEINTAKKVYGSVLEWFDDFNTVIPSWYSD